MVWTIFEYQRFLRYCSMSFKTEWFACELILQILSKAKKFTKLPWEFYRSHLMKCNVNFVATTIRILPPKSAVARSRNLPTSWTHFTMLVYYDSLSLSFSFSSQLKTCHQARQTYEINPLVSSESVSVRTSYFKAIVSSDSRHALARLTIPRRLDTRYTNTTASLISSTSWYQLCWFSFGIQGYEGHHYVGRDGRGLCWSGSEEEVKKRRCR